MSLLLALSGGGGGVSYSLTGNAGTYAVTGGTAALSVGRKLTANAGTYSYTGVSASLSVGRKLTASAGSYAIAGGTAALSVGRKITANAGTYSLTGGSVALSVGRRITANGGTYSFAGYSATLTKTGAGANYTLTGNAGVYVITGGSADLTLTAKTGGGYDYDTPKKRKKKYIVEREGKLLVFASAQAASDAISAIKANAAEKMPDIVETVAISEVKQFVKPTQVDKMLTERHLNKLLAQYEQMREEQDIEDILMML